MKKHISARRTGRSVKASRNVRTRRTTSSLRTRRAVTAAQVTTDIYRYQPWSGAKDTYDRLHEFNCWDAFVDFLDMEYYDEKIGEGVIGETELNDLLWFEPGFCFEAVGLYYDAENDEVSDEPFDDEDY